MSDIVKKYVDLTGLGTFKSEVSDLIDSKISAIDDFTGATSSTDGVAGQVPAPEAGDQKKFLRGDGTWTETSFIGTADQWNSLSAAQKAKYEIVNLTNEFSDTVVITSDTTSVTHVQCHRSGVMKQITFDGCTAASIPDGFRPTVSKYLGLAYDSTSAAPVLIYAAASGAVTVQAMDATTLSSYILYGTLTYMY